MTPFECLFYLLNKTSDLTLVVSAQPGFPGLRKYSAVRLCNVTKSVTANCCFSRDADFYKSPVSDFDLDLSKNSSLKEYMQEKVLTTVLSYRVTTPILDRPRRDFYLPLQRSNNSTDSRNMATLVQSA